MPVERIAKGLSVQLRFAPLDQELSGMVYVKDGTPVIGINAIHHPNRRRFTIAHACGHLVLHRDQVTKEVHVDKAFPMLMRDSVSEAGVEEMEVEADLFAVELLMPESLLTEALGNAPFDIDAAATVSALARRFRVGQNHVDSLPTLAQGSQLTSPAGPAAAPEVATAA